MRPGDHGAIANIWHEAWHDAHAAHVPRALLDIRGLDAFQAAMPKLKLPATLGSWEGRLGGFVIVDGNMVDRLFVARFARGTGFAAALLAEAERQIAAAGHPRAELDYVLGNDRAARFYGKHGWTILRHETDRIDLPDGGRAELESVICGKPVGAAAGGN